MDCVVIIQHQWICHDIIRVMYDNILTLHVMMSCSYTHVMSLCAFECVLGTGVCA